MDEIPATLLKNRIFEKLFEQAKVANMTKAEISAYNRSLKNSKDMNIAKREIGLAKRAIGLVKKEIGLAKSELRKKDNIIAQQANEIAELKQQLGLNSLFSEN